MGTFPSIVFPIPKSQIPMSNQPIYPHTRVHTHTPHTPFKHHYIEMQRNTLIGKSWYLSKCTKEYSKHGLIRINRKSEKFNFGGSSCNTTILVYGKLYFIQSWNWHISPYKHLQSWWSNIPEITISSFQFSCCKHTSWIFIWPVQSAYISAYYNTISWLVYSICQWTPFLHFLSCSYQALGFNNISSAWFLDIPQWK